MKFRDSNKVCINNGDIVAFKKNRTIFLKAVSSKNNKDPLDLSSGETRKIAEKIHALLENENPGPDNRTPAFITKISDTHYETAQKEIQLYLDSSAIIFKALSRQGDYVELAFPEALILISFLKHIADSEDQR